MAQINKPSEYFNTILYTGDGSSPRSLTGVNFQPDWVWLKKRNDAASHTLYDVVRTAGSTKGIATNSTAQEGLTATEGTTANYGYINSFDSDGFSVTTGALSDGYVNNSSDTYVAWNWLGGGTGVSNTDGSITSTVSASTTSGFSIVKWTGDGSASGAKTVGHSLGVTPKFVIVKKTSASASWWVGIDIDGWNWNTDYLNLNSTSAKQSDASGTVFYSAPTSSIINLGVELNASSANYIAYCFAEKKGFSKFGSYTGNGNADGPFIYTGFKPAMVIYKRSDGVEGWMIQDNRRPGYNPMGGNLFPNNTNAESTDARFDFLSNGFKARSANQNTNTSTHIYMAFAEEPLVGTNNIPATAR